MLPVQITTRDMRVSPTLETLIRKKAEKLSQFYRRIVRCHVVIEFEQKHKHQGKLYNVRLDIRVPGKELVSTYKSDQKIHIAVRDAFDAMERQLEEHARKRNGRVKTHNRIMHGYVVRLISNEGYGFIEGNDGNEYYFSMTNVHYPSFNQLVIGDAVEYVPEPFNDGWQAHHVVRERHNQTQFANNIEL